jgi:serine/threonine-protein kinase HipA
MTASRRHRRAEVRLAGAHAGVLEETNEGTRFQYDVDYLARPGSKPLSQTLPLRAGPYETPRVLHPFFANLLPEGWLLELSIKKLKVSKDDAFGLLLATCGDCVGAVEVIPLPDVGARR